MHAGIVYKMNLYLAWSVILTLYINKYIMQILEEIMSTEHENVVGGSSSTNADSEIATECIEPRNSIDIGVQ